MLFQLRQLDAALESFDRAVARDPALYQAHFNRGNVLGLCGQVEQALAALEKAVVAQPDFAAAHLQRGNLLGLCGQHEVARSALQEALRGDPALSHLEGMILGASLQLFDWTDIEARIQRILEAVDRGEPVATPFNLLSIPSTARQQQSLAELYVHHVVRPMTPADRPVWPSPGPRLRLAYLSTDFHDHPVAQLIAEVFELHDRGRFEITGLSLSHGIGGAMHQRIAGAFERFLDISQMSDEGVVRLMRELEIDVAIDLNGYTADELTTILAQRAAPIQVNYLGYPGTMGAGYMDYIIADPVVVPPEHREFCTEKVVSLPHCYQPNDRQRPPGRTRTQPCGAGPAGKGLRVRFLQPGHEGHTGCPLGMDVATSLRGPAAGPYPGARTRWGAPSDEQSRIDCRP